MNLTKEQNMQAPQNATSRLGAGSDGDGDGDRDRDREGEGDRAAPS